MITLLLLAQLAVTAPASIPEETHLHLLHAWIAASIVMHGIDLSLTSYAMGKVGDQYREANPFMRPFAGDPVTLATAKMSVAVGMNYWLLRAHRQHPQLTLTLAVAQTLAVGFVARHNAQVLRRP